MSTFDLVFDCPRLYTVVAPGVCTAAGIPIESGPQSKFRRWGFEISKRVQTRGIGFAVGPFGEVLSIEAEVLVLSHISHTLSDHYTYRLKVFYHRWRYTSLGKQSTYNWVGRRSRLKRKNLLARAKQRNKRSLKSLTAPSPQSPADVWMLSQDPRDVHPISRPDTLPVQVIQAGLRPRGMLARGSLRRDDVPPLIISLQLTHVYSFTRLTCRIWFRICHIDTLHDSDAIDQVYESRRRLAKAVAAGWLRHVSWIKGLVI
eukprot:1360797-Amorphochlora_amoeboformis.AAC.1